MFYIFLEQLKLIVFSVCLQCISVTKVSGVEFLPPFGRLNGIKWDLCRIERNIPPQKS